MFKSSKVLLGLFLEPKLTNRQANDRFVEAKIVGRFAIEVSYAKTKWATRDGFPEVQDGFRHLMHVARGERGHLEEQEEDDDGDAGKEDTHGGPSDKSRVVE